MEDFLKFLVSPLLTDPSSLSISSSDSTITVLVPQADMGRLIGRHGQSISYLRTLFQTYCKLNHLPTKYLQIKESA